MKFLTSLFFGSALGIASLRLHSFTSMSPIHRLKDWHQSSLNDAVGPVLAPMGGAMQVSRQQWVSVATVAMFGAVVLVFEPSFLNALYVALVIAAAWQIPLLLARSKEKKRQLVIDTQLNDALSELVMGVEAGMTLEAVMNMHAERRDTELSREFKHLLNQVNIGVTRSEALDEMMLRTPTTGTRMFATAVQQNQKLGTPLAASLRQQAQSSRRRRRQNAEEKAARLSLKMIFPTVFCILPVLLIVVVGPAIVRLVHTLP
jgi:tight adherence protein C